MLQKENKFTNSNYSFKLLLLILLNKFEYFSFLLFFFLTYSERKS